MRTIVLAWRFVLLAGFIFFVWSAARASCGAFLYYRYGDELALQISLIIVVVGLVGVILTLLMLKRSSRILEKLKKAG
jgi:uncharacterized membrane protein YedE/YeeE